MAAFDGNDFNNDFDITTPTGESGAGGGGKKKFTEAILHFDKMFEMKLTVPITLESIFNLNANQPVLLNREFDIEGTYDVLKPRIANSEIRINVLKNVEMEPIDLNNPVIKSLELESDIKTAVMSEVMKSEALATVPVYRNKTVSEIAEVLNVFKTFKSN